ncbi:c-type cytochrome biogenesis protein CcmI [Balneatrix alpica]|uniref:C-type cytochrome biogenesis protein CcmI n=1 Tax=Balneatrix alpica TaxID=75684 RepID=A0ABV5ZE16_9GAMM|nr:c-type cytochrome biogenesis protein CcmI [Balneatrix alpica]
MLTLWIAIALMVLLGAGFILMPLFQYGRHQQNLRQQTNILLYRQKLEDLQLEWRRGQLSEQDYQALKLETEQALLADMPQQETGVAERRRPLHLIVVFVLVSLTALVSLGLYHKLGAAPALAQRQWLQEQAGLPSAQLAENLQQRLAQGQGGLEDWFMLAGVQMELGRFEQAATSYQNLLQQLPADAPVRKQVLGQRAQALFFASGNRITQDVKAAIDQTLAEDANNALVMSLLGIAAFDQGLFQEAIAFWQRALEGTQSSSTREALQVGITRAQQALGQSVEAPAVNQVGPVLRLEVSLAEGLQNQLRGSETLFALIRLPGQNMPLAAAKYSLGNWPLTLQLDNNQSMTGAGIPLEQELEVEVRILKGQGVALAPGDLFANSRVIFKKDQLEQNKVLEIDQIQQ